MLWAHLCRPDPGTEPGLASHPAEQTGSRLLDHIEFGFVGCDAELIQGCLTSRIEGLAGGFYPLHDCFTFGCERWYERHPLVPGGHVGFFDDLGRGDFDDDFDALVFFAFWAWAS